MNNYHEENSTSGTPKWLLILRPFVSALLGVSALWYAWYRYTNMAYRPDSQWYGWIQLALIAMMGILCLSAVALFVSGKSSGSSVFKAGLSIIPLLLFSNLVVLMFRAIQNIIQGNATFFLDRLIAQPQRIVLILIVLIALGLLGSLNERANRE